MARDNKLTDIIFFHLCKINGDRKSQELRLSTCIQLRMTKHPSRKVMDFRHLLGCDTRGLAKLEISMSVGRIALQ